MYELEHNILIKTEIMDNLGRGIFVLGLIIIFKIGHTWLKDDQTTKGILTSFGIYSYILFQTFYRFGPFKNRITNSILSAEIKELLIELEFHVLNILSISIKLGDTYIITNASEGWVESSATKFLPKITQLFNKIKIISARRAYENQFPNNSKIWKLAVFRDIGNLYNKNAVTNIISFGDSIIENDAAVKFGSLFKECFIKTIKLKEEPKIEDMIKQLELISKQFNFIHSSARDIFLVVEKKGHNKNKK